MNRANHDEGELLTRRRRGLLIFAFAALAPISCADSSQEEQGSSQRERPRQDSVSREETSSREQTDLQTREAGAPLLAYGRGPYELPDNSRSNQESFGMNVLSSDENWQQSYLTDDYISFDPDISPSGGRIALVKGLGGYVEYTLNKFETESIYVMNDDGSDARRLTGGPPENKPQWSSSDTGAPSGPWDSSPVFSPDGERIAFSRDAGEGRDPEEDGIWIADTRSPGGGPEQIARVQTDRDSGPMPLTFSPDEAGETGGRIAYTDEDAVWTVDAGNPGASDPERLFSAGEQDLGNILDLEYSPDGSRLAVSAYGEGGNEGKVVVVDTADTGGPAGDPGFEELAAGDTGKAGLVSWTPDGEQVIFKGKDGLAAVEATGEDESVETLHAAPRDAGALSGIDFGFDWGAYPLDEAPEEPSSTEKGLPPEGGAGGSDACDEYAPMLAHSFFSDVEEDMSWSVEVYDHRVGAGYSPTRDTFSTYEPDMSPDGKRLAYVNGADGRQHERGERFFEREEEGLEHEAIHTLKRPEDTDYYGQTGVIGGRPLTEGPNDTDPEYSSGGEHIAFSRGGSGAPSPEVWVMNADGTDQRALTEGPDDRSPTFSPDGERISFIRSGGVWSVPANDTGAEPEKLLDESDLGPYDIRQIRYSPERDELAVGAIREGGGEVVGVVDPDTGHSPELRELAAGDVGGVSWTPDSKHLIYGKGPDNSSRTLGAVTPGGERASIPDAPREVDTRYSFDWGPCTLDETRPP